MKKALLLLSTLLLLPTLLFAGQKVTGDLQVTNLTDGSALFSGADGVISQDRQSYLFNNTENRLSLLPSRGSENVTNGTFTGNATGWTVPSGMAYSSNSVSKTSNGTGALVQNFTPYTLREYELSYIITNWTVGTVTPSIGGWTGTAVSANGTYTERFTAVSTGNITFTPSNTARFTIDTISLKVTTGSNTKSNLNVGGLSVEGSWSNGTPNTTRAMTFNNDGSYTWTDYRFAGVLRGSQGANSSGGYDVYMSGGNYFALYGGNSGLTSNSLYSYNYPSAFVHYGDGRFGNDVSTGTTADATSTIDNYGTTALDVNTLAASGSIDGTATLWILDAASAEACSGTASTACASHGSEGDCGNYNSHGGCTWNPGNSCAVFSYESGMGSCIGTSGCNPSTGSCSGGDESTCLSSDDSYGGNCSWDYTSSTCGSFTNTTDCNAASPCYANVSSDCGTFTDGGGDGSACATQPECSYDSGSGVCSNYYFTSCDGDNSSYTCNGSYYSGDCTGVYGSGCSGTPSCSGISVANCPSETGCSVVSSLSASLPDGETCPNRLYGVSSDSSGNQDVIITPYSGQTINKASTYTLSNNTDAAIFAYKKKTRSCNIYSTEGACTPSGCTPNKPYCSYDTMMSTCSGDSGYVCSAHNGDQSGCEAQQYFLSCDGIETVSKNWHVFADMKANDLESSGTCTSSASTTCTATVVSGCKPVCSMTTSVSTTMRCAVSGTTLTATFGTSGTNTANYVCF